MEAHDSGLSQSHFPEIQFHGGMCLAFIDARGSEAQTSSTGRNALSIRFCLTFELPSSNIENSDA